MGHDASMTDPKTVDRPRAKSSRVARRRERGKRTGFFRVSSPGSRSVRFENTVVMETTPRDIPVKPTTNTRKAVHFGFDGWLVAVVFTLIVFGLLMVHSASWEYSLADGNSPTLIFQRQVLFLVIGCCLAAFLAWFDYHRIQKFIPWVMLAVIVILFVVLIIGERRLGATRSFLGGSGQPSELAKLVIIIYLGVWLYAKRDRLSEIGFGLLPLAGILGVVGGLIFSQPDYSAVATIILLGGILFFLAGGDLRQISLLVFGALVFGAIVVLFTTTGKARVDSYVGGLKDLTLASDHVIRSIEAFVRGGWFGVGIGKGVTKLTILPVPHTDSIFAVVGEETGVLGSGFLILMYSLLIWRGLGIARSAPDGLGRLLAAGLTIWIGIEAFINMAVMVNLLPFAGNALPFISAGGSSLIVSVAAVGILVNISRQSVQKREVEEKLINAVIDLRRRYWRRSVPRSSHPSSPGLGK